MNASPQSLSSNEFRDSHLSGTLNKALLVLSVCAGLILSGLFAFYAFEELKEGHSWGDDFGLYLQMSKNILEGQPYNRFNTGLEAPPGYPFALVLWQKAFGTSFVALKSINIVGWVTAGWAIYAIGLLLFGPVAAFAALAIHLIVPSYFFQQQAIVADIWFVFTVNTTFLFVLLYERALSAPKLTRYALLFAFGLSLYYSYLTKPAALLVAVPIALHFCLAGLKGRNVEHFYQAILGVVVIGIVTVLANLQYGSASSGHLQNIVGMYSENGSFSIANILTSLAERARQELLNLHILLLSFPVSLYIAGIAVGSALICSFFYYLYTRDTLIPLFVAGFGAAIVIVPFQGGFRYLLPLGSVLPLLYISPAMLFARRLIASTSTWRIVNGVGLILSLAGLFVLVTTMYGRAVQAKGFNDDEISDLKTSEMIAWVKKNTASDDLICSFKPRAVMYLTSRTVCSASEIPSAGASYWFDQLGADYVIAFTRKSYVAFANINKLLADDKTVEVAFANSDYAIYRRRQQP